MTKAININKHDIAAGETFTFKNNYYAYYTQVVTRVTASSVFHTRPHSDREFRESIATWNKRIDEGKLVGRVSASDPTLRSELERQMEALDLHFSETDPDTLAEIIEETLEYIEGYEGDSFAEMVRDYLDDVMSGEGAAAIMQEIDFLAVCETCADAKEARRNCAECGREWTVDQSAPTADADKRDGSSIINRFAYIEIEKEFIAELKRQMAALNLAFIATYDQEPDEIVVDTCDYIAELYNDDSNPTIADVVAEYLTDLTDGNADDIVNHEFVNAAERLCVSCGFRLAVENSLFCDRDKCVKGSTVHNAAGECLFMPLPDAITPERIAELQKAERDRRDERATFNAEGF